MQSTERAADGVFVRIHSAVALAGGSEWNEASVRTALASFLRPNLTAGELGTGWRQTNGYYELDGLRSLLAAVRGKYLIVSDDAALISGMLANVNRKIEAKPATFIAGFDHQRERENFSRFASSVDRPDMNQQDNPANARHATILLGEYREPQLDSCGYFFGKDRGSLGWRQRVADRYLQMDSIANIATKIGLSVIVAAALSLALVPTIGGPVPALGAAPSPNPFPLDASIPQTSLYAQSAAQVSATRVSEQGSLISLVGRTHRSHAGLSLGQPTTANPIRFADQALHCRRLWRGARVSLSGSSVYGRCRRLLAASWPRGDRRDSGDR